MPNSNVNKVVLGDGTILIDLTNDTVDQAKVLSGYSFHDKTGALKQGTCTFDADTSDDDAAASEILLGRKAHVRGVLVTGEMPNNGSATVLVATLNDATIPAGFHDGGGKAGIYPAEKAKIIPGNIRQGVTILGVEGTMSGSEGVVAQAKTATPSFSQQVITPDTAQGYTHLSQVTVGAISVVYTPNAAGGNTVSIGG